MGASFKSSIACPTTALGKPVCQARYTIPRAYDITYRVSKYTFHPTFGISTKRSCVGKNRLVCLVQTAIETCLHPVYHTVPCCIVLHCAVLYCTLRYCTVLYCTVRYFVLYCTVLFCTLLYFIVLYCAVLYRTSLYDVVLHCPVLCSTVLCCIVR